MVTKPVVEGWFTTGERPALVGSRCTSCATVWFPPLAADAPAYCRNPHCEGVDFESAELSRLGRIWSYTDSQYRPPAPYVPQSEPYVPFALAAVELPEGLTVLGQVATGFGVADLRVGAEVELVVETLHATDDGELLTWRWKPVTEMGAEADQ